MKVLPRKLASCMLTDLRFDGNSHVVIWGYDELDMGTFARDARGDILVSTPLRSRSIVEEQGWEWLMDPGLAIFDFEPVQEWLRRQAPLDPEACLGLWNSAVDVALTLGVPFRQRGAIANECYDKLFAAAHPRYSLGVDYWPRWTPVEYRVLRRVLSDALHILRIGIPETVVA